MADLNMTFDPNTVEAGRDFEPIPAGEYMAQIVSSDVRPTNNGAGLMLKLRFDVVDGQPYGGRVIWDQLCYQHSNPQTQLIAQQQIKRICEAIGHVGPVTNSESLHFKPMLVRVAIDPAKNGYAAKNVIKGIKPIGGSAPPSGSAPASNPSTARSTNNGGSAPTQQHRPAAAAATGAVRPWGNRAATA